MKLSEFDYHLPEELIAQTPLKDRETSRLMVIDKETGEFTHTHFNHILDYFNKGDVLVMNNTRVIPARLFGTKEETGAHVEILILKTTGDILECLVGNAKVVKPGVRITFKEGILSAVCLEKKEEGICIFKFEYEGILMEKLEILGQMPLPPYIKEKLEDKDRYQTVYAKVDGSAAAPTAGLHFTKKLLKQLQDKGVDLVEVTLHVGLGTFRPVKVDDVSQHVMHYEDYSMSKKSADFLNNAKLNGKKIYSVGTTTTRVLETQMKKHGKFVEETSSTNLFITPGFEFKAVDAQITNFHLPKSTLLMLVSAFSSRELMLKAYNEAVKEHYGFFSFGDAMLIK